MRPEQHAPLSVGSGVILGLVMNSWTAGAVCALSGILIDLDHLLDFWLNRGFRVSLQDFFDFCYRGTSRKFFDILHGWEYILPMVWLARQPGWTMAGIGLTVGYALHLLADQIFNTHLHRFTYFISYRLAHRFESSFIVLEPGGPVRRA